MLEIVIFLVIVSGIWILVSQDRLASAIRARFQGTKAKVANAMDNAMARMEAAETEIAGKVAAARNGLIEVKSSAKAAETNLARARGDVQRWIENAILAVKNGNQTLARICLARQKEAEVLLLPLRDQVSALKKSVKQVQEAYDKLQGQQAELGRQKQQIKARAAAAKAALDVNQLLAGIDLNGQSDNARQALRLVEEAEARAAATGEVAANSLRDQDIEKQLAQLSGHRSDIDADLARLTQQYAPDSAGTST